MGDNKLRYLDKLKYLKCKSKYSILIFISDHAFNCNYFFWNAVYCTTAFSNTKFSRLSQKYWQTKPFRLKDQNLNSVDRIHICRNEIKEKNAKYAKL